MTRAAIVFIRRRRLGLQLHVLKAASELDFDAVFASITNLKPIALGWLRAARLCGERPEAANETEAELVRSIFRRFAKLGSGTKLVRQLAQENVRNRYGKLIDKGALYKMLNNRTYVGEAVHKGTAYPGEHQPIIDRAL